MSFTPVKSVKTRINRSELFVPGSKPDLFEKASTSNADIICLDLEDAVAPQDKEAAKQNVIKALNNHDFGNKTISVRINGLDTHYCYRDVVDLMELGGERLDLIMIPKVGVPEDVYAIDMLVTQIEDKIRLKEASNEFDDEFIQLARSVYQQNDKRASLKREINLLYNSQFIEEKLYH